MSLLIKVLAGFPVVAGVSTYSLTLATHKDKEEKVETIVDVPSTPPVTVKEEEQVSPPAIQEEKVQSVKQMMEEIIERKNYEGCAEITVGRNRWGALWFVCFSRDGSNKPALYNYDRSRKEKKSIVTQVVSISAYPNREMKFEGGGTEKLKLTPSWMGRLIKGRDLTPEKNCSLAEKIKAKGKPTYTLSCYGEEIQSGIEFEKKKDNSVK